MINNRRKSKTIYIRIVHREKKVHGTKQVENHWARPMTYICHRQFFLKFYRYSLFVTLKHIILPNIPHCFSELIIWLQHLWIIVELERPYFKLQRKKEIMMFVQLYSFLFEICIIATIRSFCSGPIGGSNCWVRDNWRIYFSLRLQSKIIKQPIPPICEIKTP